MTESSLSLTTRKQTPKPTGWLGWALISETVSLPAHKTAFIVVDMWDSHWSRGAVERVGILAPRMNKVIHSMREQGVQIVHAPSDVVNFYEGYEARRWVAALPQISPPSSADHPDPPLPIDDSDGGSDTGETETYKAWSRQHPAIEIKSEDAISADGLEIYNILAHKQLENIIFAGVHTNMCVLNRPFAIKQMVRWGFNVILARDLTDAMYNPLMPPYVSHDEGTQLVIQYIEKFWCPTITSDDLTRPR
ncbi:MAG: cysteine hydrolase family protein [Chloroflexota bacterium]